MFSGTGVGGLVMPIVSAALLRRFGSRTTLLAIVHNPPLPSFRANSQGITYLILLGLLVPFIRPRLPLPSRTNSAPPKLDMDFAKHAAFWILWAGVLFQGLAAFVPGTYLPGESDTWRRGLALTLPAYASALKLPNSVGTLSVALMNLARVPGQVIIGHASDKLGARLLIVFMALASGLTVMTGWGLAHDTGGVLGFAIAFGLFAGSYTALFPK